MNDTHLIIFNRGTVTADGWIHIVPKGELANREAKLVQVLDDKALDSILANINSEKQKLGDKWPGIYAGREHFIYNAEQDSAALAWFKDFEKRDDGIWAKDDGLTDIGSDAIKNKRYKFTSFVADRRDTQKLDGNRVRILKVETVGFTNQANGKELLTPITNRNNLPGARASAASNQNQNERTNTMKNIAQKLGLAAEASEDAILEAVTKVMNRNTTLEPLEAETTTLKNRITTLESEQIDVLLDAHGIKADDKVRNRLKPALLPLKNREERLLALTDFGFKLVEAKPGKGTETRILNRQDNKGAQQDVTTGAAATPQQLNAEIRKIMNRDGIKDFTTGYNALMAEKPELFARE